MKKIIYTILAIVLVLATCTTAFAGSLDYAYYSMFYNEVSRRAEYLQNGWHTEYITFDDDDHTEVEYGSPVQCTYDWITYSGLFENHKPTGQHTKCYSCSICNHYNTSKDEVQNCTYKFKEWRTDKNTHTKLMVCTSCNTEVLTDTENHNFEKESIGENNGEYHITRYKCKDCGYTKDVKTDHTDDYCVQITKFGKYYNVGTNHEIYFRCNECGCGRAFKYDHEVDMTTVRYVCDHKNNVYYSEAYCAGCNSWVKVESVENPEYTYDEYYIYVNQIYCDYISITKCIHCNYSKTTRTHRSHVATTHTGVQYATGDTYCENCGAEIAKDRSVEPTDDKKTDDKQTDKPQTDEPKKSSGEWYELYYELGIAYYEKVNSTEHYYQYKNAEGELIRANTFVQILELKNGRELTKIEKKAADMMRRYYFPNACDW